MKNYLNKKKKLFDGDQNQFVLEVWSIHCGKCREKIQFNISDCFSFIHLDSILKRSVLSEIKNIESKKLGDVVFYKTEGLPISFFQKTCSTCGAANLGILGLGEYQPARYMVILIGLII